jgi:uncharacterized protein (TIGR01777 family)
MSTVLITGGTGLIGKRLQKKLPEKGFKVSILSSDKSKVNGINVFSWAPNKGEINKRAIAEADYIINLSGENIGEKKWSPKQKDAIFSSRLHTTNLLFEAVREYNKNLKAFISASAVGYYGAITSEKIFTETDAPASDFLGTVCQKWEEAADQFTSINIRTVKIRTATVLSSNDGALGKMLGPVKKGFGAALGNGDQYLPWIHIDDLCDIYIKAIEDETMRGAYNAVAPEHKTNKEFMRELAKTFNKPFWFPKAPSFVLKMMLGEMSDLVLKGSRVSSEKIIAKGFKYKFPLLSPALKDLFKSK